MPIRGRTGSDPVMTRFVFMMLDGAGVGELPDAAEYGDVGSNTLGNVSRLVDLRLPNLGRLGLGNIIPLRNVPPVQNPAALPGRLAPLSAGKDTTVGHWEHMGLVTSRPFPTYPEGFPEEIVASFRDRIGRGVLGNKPASGTAIIDELGERHIANGWPIVYTSADSVFQIAAHIEIVPLEQLYEWCEIARELLQGAHAVARVIARPFTGRPGEFARTKDRRDYSLAPPAPLYLDLLEEAEVPVMALGKISEIYLGRGVTTKIKVGSNAENLALMLDLLRGTSGKGSFEKGLLFTNLVDFDMAWGHRNDPDGFGRGLEAVDVALPGIIGELTSDDRLIITADHGVDPTTRSTDHSREYVPLLLYPRPDGAPHAVYEGGFADTGATVYSDLAGGEPSLAGRSIGALRPDRGWRRYTGTVKPLPGNGEEWPAKVGSEEATEAARWLRDHCGDPPEVAIVLGSGLSEPLRAALGVGREISRAVSYAEIPGWRAGAVPGHPGVLQVAEIQGIRTLLLEGRLHAYEGFDLSELQFAVRTVAIWGIRNILFTCAAGGLMPGAPPGWVVLVSEVLDFQYPRSDGSPSRLEGTDASLVARLTAGAGLPAFVGAGVHAAVPGPQYETESENALLRGLGAACVSMSLPAELRAARDEGMAVAALSLITNEGATSHDDVLAAAAAQGARLLAAVSAVLAAWKPRVSVY
jgi:phosphopentomutase